MTDPMTAPEFPTKPINGNASRCDWWWDIETALEPGREAILDGNVDGALACVREADHPGPHLLATSEELQANYPTPLEGSIPDDEGWSC